MASELRFGKGMAAVQHAMMTALQMGWGAQVRPQVRVRVTPDPTTGHVAFWGETVTLGAHGCDPNYY